jgi:hypothetical protein
LTECPLCDPPQTLPCTAVEFFTSGAAEPKRQVYEYLDYQIDREDNLVNNRLSWTLQLNGFLFAAFALIGTQMSEDISRQFRSLLPWAGLAVSIAGLGGIIASQIAILSLTRQWKKHDLTREPWPRPFGAPFAFTHGTVPLLFCRPR